MNNEIINPKTFAEIVLKNSSFAGTNEEIITKSLALYEEAFDRCVARNKPIADKQSAIERENREQLMNISF